MCHQLRTRVTTESGAQVDRCSLYAVVIHFQLRAMSKAHRTNPSATLKLTKRNVMLYSCEYDRTAKATRQRYLAGFSRAATAIPPEFAGKLRACVADPGRRQAMLERIEIEVLVPARQLEAERGRRNATMAALAPLVDARRAFGRAARCVESAEASEELEAELSRLRQAYEQLERVHPSHTDGRDSLRAAFRNLTSACEQVAQAVQAMPRGTIASSDAVNAWQRTWYQYQDMLSAVTRRSAFKRPAGWSDKAVRAKVEAGDDANQCAGAEAESTR